MTYVFRKEMTKTQWTFTDDFTNFAVADNLRLYLL